MKKIYRYVILTTILTGAAVMADAGAEAGFHKHDGFYLNLMGGVGAIGFSESVGTSTVKINGTAGHFGLKLGGAISENVILFGALDGFSALNPSYTITTSTASGSGSLTNTTYGISSIGGGIALYTDSNFFLAATLGMAKGTLQYTSGAVSVTGATDYGIAANLNIGKEWWVSKDWGLGVAVVGHFSNVKDAGNSATQIYGGLAFSATYN